MTQSDVVTQSPKVSPSSGVQSAPSEIDWDQVFHITQCEEDHVEKNLNLPCCNTALCGADLTNMEWTKGVDEIPCPLCFHTEEQEAHDDNQGANDAG